MALASTFARTRVVSSLCSARVALPRVFRTARSLISPRHSVVRASSSTPDSSAQGNSPWPATLMASQAADSDDESSAKNVLGGPLQTCCTAPMTGYYRDGFCRTDASDHGKHVVCAKMTTAFLEYSKSRGNDLMTAHPPSFPGLKAGDKWCLCAERWKEAYNAGCAPGVYMASTHIKALAYVDMAALQKHAVDA